MALRPTKANVPFDFQGANITLEAGTYTIEDLLADVPGMLALRDSNDVRRAIISGSRLEASKDAQAPHLTFNRDDDGYALTEVWANDAISGTGVRQSRGKSKTAIARRHPAETVTVALAR